MDRGHQEELDGLVERYRQGEVAFLERLVTLLSGPVYAYVLRLGVPQADASDVVAEFLEHLFEYKIWRYSPRAGSSFWSWTCAVVANQVKDWRRRRGAVPESLEHDFMESSDTRSATRTDASVPSERMVHLLQAFRRAFHTLTPLEQDL